MIKNAILSATVRALVATAVIGGGVATANAARSVAGVEVTTACTATTPRGPVPAAHLAGQGGGPIHATNTAGSVAGVDPTAAAAGSVHAATHLAGQGGRSIPNIATAPRGTITTADLAG